MQAFETGTINGPDDYIGERGDDAMAEVFGDSVLPPAQQVSDLLNDKRPRVILPTDNRLLTDFAGELGKHMRGMLYAHNREVVIVEDGEMRPITAQELRTTAERGVICCKLQTKQASVSVGRTMSTEDARGVMVSSTFLAALDPLESVASCRQPVIRQDGKIELLPPGYDPASQTMTVPHVEYPDDMPFNDALAVMRDLFSEFAFADTGRSLAVAVAALVGLYAAQLVCKDSLRPVFLYTKNGEGAGASTAVACATVPVVGNLTRRVKPNDDAEMRKLLTSALRAGDRIIMFDNVKTTIGGAALEAFTSAPRWRDRLLGSNTSLTLDNNATVFVTANGAVLTPDMRRRSLICELHLAEERAEDRVYKRPLNDAVIKSMRPRLLAACWALVRHWDEMGRPQPSRSHSAFPEWARAIGGVVEDAGFGCPLDTPDAAIVADEDGDAMRQLVTIMTPEYKYTAAELYAMCRRQQIFTTLVGLRDGDMGRSELSMMGYLLARYHNRRVGAGRFVITGKAHAKRFSMEQDGDLHGCTVEHGLPPRATKNDDFRPIDINTVQTMQTMQTTDEGAAPGSKYHEELL
jgi:hypothetical protein